MRAGGHTRAHKRSRRRSTMPPSLLPPNRTSSAMLPSVKRTFRRNGGGEREHGAECARARVVAAGAAPAALRRRDRPGRWGEGPKGCDERAQLPEGRPRGWGRMHGGRAGGAAVNGGGGTAKAGARRPCGRRRAPHAGARARGAGARAALRKVQRSARARGRERSGATAAAAAGRVPPGSSVGGARPVAARRSPACARGRTQ